MHEWQRRMQALSSQRGRQPARLACLNLTNPVVLQTLFVLAPELRQQHTMEAGLVCTPLTFRFLLLHLLLLLFLLLPSTQPTRLFHSVDLQLQTPRPCLFFITRSPAWTNPLSVVQQTRAQTRKLHFLSSPAVHSIFALSQRTISCTNNH